SHKTGLEIAAFDVNHDRTTAILAGREILKTVRIDNDRCAEETNLRAKLTQVASHRDEVAGTRVGLPRNLPSHRANLNIHDVKWSHKDFDSCIATASTSGKIVLYDLNKHSLELARLHEHSRQVHKLAFSPFQGYGLLSASQDGSVRFWDLRDLSRNQSTVYAGSSSSLLACGSRYTYSTNQADGVRDVKWSPVDAVQFAFGTDSGTVQCWDLRFPVRPTVKITAHDKIVTCVDWHPGGQYLASGSADKTIRCWNIGPGPSQEEVPTESKNPNKRLKPSYSIRCPAPVAKIAWRTPAWSDIPIPSINVWQTTHLAASYATRDLRTVHVWDFRRPHIPFRGFSPFDTAPTDLLWHSQHLLWLVSREGIFTQADVALAPKCIDRRPWAAIGVNPAGDSVAAVTSRPRK
ncbi:WD40 repeat-like protein, partial [Eremomyces bilateralis CBS 781.70]